MGGEAHRVNDDGSPWLVTARGAPGKQSGRAYLSGLTYHSAPNNAKLGRVGVGPFSDNKVGHGVILNFDRYGQARRGPRDLTVSHIEHLIQAKVPAPSPYLAKCEGSVPSY